MVSVKERFYRESEYVIWVFLNDGAFGNIYKVYVFIVLIKEYINAVYRFRYELRIYGGGGLEIVTIIFFYIY